MAKSSKDRNLILFEGCNSALGCTIVLSGPVQPEPEKKKSKAQLDVEDYSELSDLKKVKLALREMLKLSRNVILEKTFLYQLYISVPKPIDEH